MRFAQSWLIWGAFVARFVNALPFLRPPRPNQIIPPQASFLTGPNVCSFQRPVVNTRCVQNPWSCLGQRPINRVVTEYRCCPGYARHVATNTCIKVDTRPTIIDRAKLLKLKEFLKVVVQTRLDSMLANNGNFTVFAPSDRAFRRYYGIHPDVERNTRNLTTLLRRHIVLGMYSTQVIGQDQLLMSLDVPQNLRVTWSADKNVTVIQGARIIKPNQFAKNGVIHIIDKVIERTTFSVVQYISSNPELTKFGELTARLATNLTGPLTLFVPTNGAFAKLKMHPDLWSLVSGSGSCLKRLVQCHLVEQGVYVAGVIANTVLSSREGSQLVIETSNNTATVANATIITRDISVTNGVLHVISDVIIPPRLRCQ